MTFHITRITRRKGPVGGGRISRVTEGAARVNLCGGTLTDHDVTVREAHQIVKTGFALPGWERCDGCFQRLLREDFNKSRKVED